MNQEGIYTLRFPVISLHKVVNSRIFYVAGAYHQCMWTEEKRIA